MSIEAPVAVPAVAPPAHPRRAPFAPFGGYGWFGIQVAFALMMTIGHWGDYARPWLVVVAASVSGAISALPLSARWARTAVGNLAVFGWLGIFGLVAAQVAAPPGELSVLWPATSATLAMGLLTMVGQWRLAWSVTVLVLIQGVLWGIARNVPLDLALEQVGILTAPVAGTVYRALMRTARRREATARQEEATALEEIGRLASQAEARREYRTRILRQVGAILERIEAAEELTPAERDECRLTEASLRDAIRGRGFATREILQAARSARERGATVSLIDDRRTDCSDEVCRNVMSATRQTLEQAVGGDSFVARLLPLGRRNVATVLLVNPDGEGVRREFTMPPSGNPADGAVERPPVTLTA
ncbi:MAG: hypothetical protein Q4F67_05630 [Propionibacteriaceae bacterium]|nr:hypothetical protein [Propionibacteriaceae bacterium]